MAVKPARAGVAVEKRAGAKRGLATAAMVVVVVVIVLLLKEEDNVNSYCISMSCD